MDYFPFGDIRIDQKAGSFDEQRKFTGHEYDADTQLSYMNARYYKGDIGRFASQDPMFLVIGSDLSIFQKEIEELLADPQDLNAYSYARNNPLHYIDPLGMFNIETGQVEKGDTLTSVTQIINDQYQTNYSVEQIANLNDISNPDYIEVGWIIVPNQTAPDITNELNGIMQEHAEYAQENDYGWGQFAWKVAPGHAWDLKSQPGKFCSMKECGYQKYENFVYNGNWISYDAPGNIHYGYVGHAIGIGLKTLQDFGHIVQFLQSGQADSIQDQYATNYGYDLYESLR